ncbi:TonB-dependent receptor [Zhongshania aquimaris]|uniref:TonB-dependent receptor n=1 Tax=Zhongshania aquimaris TaxID=2857107 RepID=A0ABS6VUU6_9GAMM|nr:TonB-dependent receptor [Zhongshania aquimaris]MBW2942093.1 TonB-dependent receptor [Zhongshania aquimaris]
MFSFRPYAISAGALIAVVASVNSSYAQQSDNGLTLEEVVVTAQKKSESLQDAPISLLAFDSEKLEKLGVSDVGDIQGAVPNLSTAPHPSNRNSLTAFIRGVGNADLQITKDPAVGVYLDGVYLGRSAGLTADIADVQAIEVLRGPQGTLYGRNTTGGAISIRSAQPDEEFSLKQKLSKGNRGYWRSLTQANIPLSDTLMMRAAFSRSAEDGWVENTGAGKDFGEQQKLAARIAIRWLVNDAVSIDYAYDQSEIEGGQLAYQLSRTTNANGAGFAPFARESRQSSLSVNNLESSSDDVSGHSLVTTWFVNDDLTVKSITAYRDLDEFAYQDYSASAHHFSGGMFPSLVASGAEILDTRTDKVQDQISQEIQFLGTMADGKIDYVGGLYYFKEEGSEDQLASLNLLALGGFPQIAEEYYEIDASAESLAAFSQLEYTPDILEQRLHLTLGLRYTSDKREATKYDNLYNNQNGATVGGDQTSSKFTPSFTAAYDISDDINAYAKIATAYRAGGFNTRGTEARFAGGFEPEELLAYEIGSKAELLNRRIRLNLAAFWYEYTDLQVDQSDPVNIIATDTFNAGEAEMSGAEMDLTAVLTRDLQLNVSYGYLDASYQSFIQYGQEVSQSKNVPSAPQHSYNVSLDYTRPVSIGELSATVNYSWEDEYYFSTQGIARKDDVGLLSATLGVSNIAIGDSELSVQLWGRNLENKTYAAHEIDWAESGFVTTIFGEPRSYGVDVTLSF